MTADNTPIERGSRSAWLFSAASLGAVAGLPWVFILQGLLISVLFAVVAAWRANQLWRSAKTPPLSWPLVIVTFVAAIVLGHPASSTWPDRCFELNLSNEKGTQTGLMVASLICVATLICSGLVERQLRRRLRRLRALSPAQPEVTSKLTVLWVGLAGLAWSVANETMFPNLMKMVWSLGDSPASGFTPDPFREPCNPEVGWVAAVLYALALVMLLRGSKSKTTTGILAESSLQQRSPQSYAVLLAALLLAQSARTFVLLRRELPELKEYGGHTDCRCMKYDDSVQL